MQKIFLRTLMKETLQPLSNIGIEGKTVRYQEMLKLIIAVEFIRIRFFQLSKNKNNKKDCKYSEILFILKFKRRRNSMYLEIVGRNEKNQSRKNKPNVG